MPAKKTSAKKPVAKQPVVKNAPPKEPKGKIIKLRPAKAKATHTDGVKQFSLQKEMLSVLGRVSGNKSKRTATALVDNGPIRTFMIALDDDATLEEDALDGNVSVQVLFGEVDVTVGRAKKKLHVGDLLVLEAGSARGAKAVDASVLLITIAVGA